jgi:hypothetical protein
MRAIVFSGVCLAFGLVASSNSEGTKQESKTPFKVDPWGSWNALKEGSSVTLKTEMTGMEMSTTKTLDKKGEEQHVLKTEMIMKMGDNDIKTPGEEQVHKIKTGAGADGVCALCGKKFSEHKDEAKWSKETLKVGDKEVKCDVWESPSKNCKGEAVPDAQKMKIWYSDEIPGQMAKMEGASFKMTVTGFNAAK